MKKKTNLVSRTSDVARRVLLFFEKVAVLRGISRPALCRRRQTKIASVLPRGHGAPVDGSARPGRLRGLVEALVRAGQHAGAPPGQLFFIAGANFYTLTNECLNGLNKLCLSRQIDVFTRRDSGYSSEA